MWQTTIPLPKDGVKRLTYNAWDKVMDVTGIGTSHIAVWSGAGDILSVAVES